jgi:hypothetical protein
MPRGLPEESPTWKTGLPSEFNMSMPPSIPPLFRQTAIIARSVAEISIAIVMGGAGYYVVHVLDPTDQYSFIAPLVVGFGLGTFGRCTVFLTGPATMLGPIIWSPIDLMFVQGVDHPSWPSEMVWYGIMACVGLAGAAIGRALKPWCDKAA